MYKRQVNFPKPDVHLRDIFTALNLCSDKSDDYQLFKAIIRVADHAGVSPYNTDKVFWLIGSGYFYADPHIGNKGRIGSRKQEFIEYLKAAIGNSGRLGRSPALSPARPEPQFIPHYRGRTPEGGRIIPSAGAFYRSGPPQGKPLPRF